MKNKDIRERIEQLNLKHYQVAEVVGISPFTFSIWLRSELTDARRRRVIAALEQLQKEIKE